MRARKSTLRRSIGSALDERAGRATATCVENLEQRRLLSAAVEVWVNDNWVITRDRTAPGLSIGDTVRNSGRGDSAPFVSRTFGVDAFSRIGDAIAAVASGGTVHVLAGNYSENLLIDKSISLRGQNASSTVLSSAGGASIVRIRADVSIRSMTIRGGGVTAGGPETTVGIDLDGGSAAINNATVTGNNIGVRVRNGGNITSMQQNFITNNSITGLEVQTTAGSIAVVFNNDFSGSGTSIENAATTPVNASGNWHGVTTQAAVATEFTGSVDVTPWLNSGTDTSAAAGFQGDFTDLNVGSIGQQAGAVTRIQEGINLASGGAGSEVFIHSGTYLDSDININKSITLDGVGPAASQVVAPAVADGHLTGSGVVFHPLTHNAMVVRASNVTIRDLTIDGDAGVGGSGSRNYFGAVVYDYNAGGFNNISVSGVTVQNLWGVGIYLDGGISNESSGHTVSGNTVTNISGSFAPTGILMIQASGSVTNNTVSNVDSGIATNYVDGSAFAPNLLIRGNNIFDVSGGITASGLDAGSFIGGPAPADQNVINLTVGPGVNDVGIVLQYPAGPVTVQNNVITGSARDSGIFLFAAPLAAAPLISGNSISTTGLVAPVSPGDSTGIFATDEGAVFGQPGAGQQTFATLSGNTVSGFWYNVQLARVESGSPGGFTVQLTINSNNNISGAAAAGIRVLDANGTSAANAVAIISGNAASIHGNAVGIDVDGGTATISGNNIYQNTIGVRVRNGGTASLDGNNFDGGANPDNDTDLQLTSSPGAVTVGATTANQFAGDTFYIDNVSTQNINAINNTYDQASNFRIEDRMHHRMDIDLPITNGLNTWVANNLYVTTPGGGSTDSNIQRGIDSASSGNVIHVEQGTYLESDINVNKPVTIDGFGPVGSQIVAPAVPDGHLTGSGVVFHPLSHNAFVIRSSNVTIRDLTINGDAGVGGPGSRNYFGGVVYDYNVGGFNNIQILNLNVQNLWGVGIYLDGGINNESSGHLVSGNTVSNIAGGAAPTGILMLQASGTVSGNVISAVETGIGTNYVDGSVYAPNLIIRQNDISDVSGGISASGLDAGSIIGGPGAGDANIINLVPGVGLNDVGIIVQFSVGSVTVQKNQITATGRDSGIFLYNISAANPALITGNTITSTSSSSTAAGEGTGIFATDEGALFGDPLGGAATFATVSGNTIDGFVRNIDLYRNQSGGGFTVQLTIDSDNEIRNGTSAGIRVFDSNGTAAANAVAIISDNGPSIHDNFVGIDVNGGTATISNNHLHNNSTAILVRNGGVATISSNQFNANGIGIAADAGSATVTNTQSVGAVAISNAGLVTIAAGSNSVLIMTSLTITGGGRLDMRDNAGIIDYTGSSPIASIQAYLLSGYSAGAWTGAGIMSTDAANEPNDRTAVGYAEATDLFGSFPATFEGQSVDSTSILLKYTLYGDADLNDNVNLNDFNRLAANFGTSPRRWSRGDFNYDLVVNLDDFNLLAGNFGLSLGPLARAEPAGGEAAVHGTPFILGSVFGNSLIGRGSDERIAALIE